MVTYFYTYYHCNLQLCDASLDFARLQENARTHTHRNTHADTQTHKIMSNVIVVKVF